MTEAVTLPPQQFYWALLDLPCPRRMTARHRRRLGFTFEGTLPVAIESVQASYAPHPSSGAIACAMDTQRVEQALAQGAISLCPAALPAWMDGPQGLEEARARLELLTGDFEPRAMTLRRRRRTCEAILLLIVVAGLICAGVERRIEAARATVRTADAARIALLNEVVPPTPEARQAPELRLVAEIRRLERLAKAPSAEMAPADASAPLADLLASWPPGVFARTRRIRASSSEITIQVALEAIEDADMLAAALSQAPGWSAGVPRVGPERAGGYLAAITFRRAEETPSISAERSATQINSTRMDPSAQGAGS